MAAKYRPILSEAQIGFLVRLTSSHDLGEPVLADSVLQTLKKLQTKIAVGLVKPHSAGDSMAEKLGLVEASSTSESEQAYNKASIATGVLTPREKYMAELYRYENNLMSEEESMKFEFTDLMKGPPI